MNVPPTHYDNLYVTRNAPTEVIRASFKVLAQKYHPDKNSSPDAERVMKIINRAWEVLSDPSRRREHDEFIRDAAKEASSTSSKPNAAQSAQANKSESFRADHETSKRHQERSLVELESLAFKLWFRGSSQESLLIALRELGLSESNAQALVTKVVNWS